jgi:hypothetical protein
MPARDRPRSVNRAEDPHDSRRTLPERLLGEWCQRLVGKIVTASQLRPGCGGRYGLASNTRTIHRARD